MIVPLRAIRRIKHSVQVPHEFDSQLCYSGPWLAKLALRSQSSPPSTLNPIKPATDLPVLEASRYSVLVSG